MLIQSLARGAAVAMMLAAASDGRAQSLVAASTQAAGVSTIVVVDPQTGATQPYLTVPVTGSGNRQVYFMTQLPDGRLAASIYTENSNADVTSELMLIDPQAGTSTIGPFGAPLNTSYIEGFEYSPRHGNLLVSFASFGNFGTNRLAVVNADGSVVSTTGALAGISDLDTILSSATSDLFFDLNAGGNPRVKLLVNPLPATTFAAFSSPPVQTAWFDGGIHPTTGEIIFTRPVSGRSQLTRLVGNAYVSGADIANSLQVRGMTWANLPPRAAAPAVPTVCPSSAATIGVVAVGTGPFAYRWEFIGGPPPATVTEWTAVVDGEVIAPAASGAPGQFLFNASNSGTSTLTVDRVTVPQGDPDGPGWIPAGVGQYRFRCIITGPFGEFTAPESSFLLAPDLNADGQINTADLTLLLVRFGQSAPAGSSAVIADLNADGAVNTADLTLLLVRFGQSCP